MTTEHQRRVLRRLLTSIDRFISGEHTIEEIRLDLEGHIEIVEEKSLSDKLEHVANELDNCLHLSEKSYEAKKVINELREHITKIVNA